VTARRIARAAGRALAILALVAIASPSAFAQEATPIPEATPVAVAPVARPAHIHSGDCVNLGDVVQPLTDLIAPVGPGGGQANRATVAESSFTTVPMTLDALLAGNYAINVHLSAERIDTYIACGEIGGPIDLNGALIIGLREMSNSGFTGIAFLQPSGDGVSTNVSVFIAPVFGPAG
jgi:hypothetical protein